MAVGFAVDCMFAGDEATAQWPATAIAEACAAIKDDGKLYETILSVTMYQK